MNSPPRVIASLLFAAILAGLSSCANFDRIDREINRLVRERSESLGGSATTPRLASPDVPELSYGSADYEKEPATTNPDIDEIDITPADPARDVSERLARYYAQDGAPIFIDLSEAFRISQRTSRDFITAEEDYILAAIALLIQRHDWNPRFFDTLSTNLSFDPTDFNGDSSAALNVINDLRVTQRLPYGGDLEASIITTATQELTDLVGDQSTFFSELQLSADFPLLRNAGLIAQESLIQAERDLVYAARDFERFRREFLVSIASTYFSLVAQKASLQNQEARIESVQILFDQTEAFVEAGRSSPFELQNVRQNLLSSIASLNNAQESYQIAKDQFKIDLGLPVTTPIEIVVSRLDVLEPDVDLVAAARTALELRLDYQTTQDTIGDQRRSVANAKNQLLPDLNVNLSARFAENDEIPEFVGFDRDGQQYQAGVTFGLPLDREIERLQLRSSIIGLQRSVRNLSRTRDQIVLSARAAVREIDRARLALELQTQSRDANLLRQRELDIKADEVTAQDRLDAENELLNTQNGLDTAKRDLNNAILNFLLVTGQMRVKRDGEFNPPPSLAVIVSEGDEQGVPAPNPDPGTPNPMRGQANPDEALDEYPAGEEPPNPSDQPD